MRSKAMKRTVLIAAAAALALGGGVSAAQADDGWKHQRNAEKHYRKAAKEYRKAQRAEARAWRRGQYLPSQYRSRSYSVSDYRRYGYAPPPAGYGYYRQGDNVLLTQIATGLIAAVLGGGSGGGYGDSLGLGSILGAVAGQSGYGYGQSYGYGQPQPRGYDQYGRPIY
jgi:Ni/Co efflux regulator RcnB